MDGPLLKMDTSPNLSTRFQKIFAKNTCKCKQIKSDYIPASANVLKHYIIIYYNSRSKKIPLKKCIETKLHPKVKFENRKQSNNNFFPFKNKSESAARICISFPPKWHQKKQRKNVGFFFHENYTRESKSKWHTVFADQNYVKKVLRNGVDLPPIEVALNKTR